MSIATSNEEGVELTLNSSRVINTMKDTLPPMRIQIKSVSRSITISGDMVFANKFKLNYDHEDHRHCLE